MTKRTTLRAACSRVDYGLTASADHASAAGPRFLRITDIDRSFIDWASVPRCNTTVDEASKYALSTGDVVVARTGASTGRSQWVEVSEPSVFASYLVRFRADAKVLDSRYLGYVLTSEPWRHFISASAHGKSAQPNLSASAMAAFEFEMPDLFEQRGIAEVLGALDDKIAANSRLGSTGWALAKASFARLQQGTATNVAVGEILTLEYGKSLPASARKAGDVAVFGSGGQVGVHDAALVDRPGIVIGRKGSAGSVHWSPGPHFPIDTTFFVVPSRADVPLTYCYFALASLRLDEMNSDSAVPGLNRGAAHAAKVRLPDATSRQAFDAGAAPLFLLASQAERESEHLAKMRDALLPQLMSGKIRVNDAERVVEGVV